ncbi:MAG: Fe-S cluster assembly sulfur transfer protein SufU [Acidimicrobiia bacterium]
MSTEDLRGLYQQLIFDHQRDPQRRALLKSPTATSHQVNPTCGDEVTLTVRVVNDRIDDVGWTGHGCSISQASASMLATLIEGMSVNEVAPLVDDFRTVLHSRGQVDLVEERFGDAIALNGVSRYPARIKCAILPWVALEHAVIG